MKMEILYDIKENTLIARIAAYNLKKDRCAVVLGSTINLWGISKDDFLNDRKYLNHELQHIYQSYTLGHFKFIVLYLIESFRKGYLNNRFEIEARSAEEMGPAGEFMRSEKVD